MKVTSEKSRVNSEQIKKIDIMLEAPLPSTFNNQIWQQISMQTPEQFLQNQQNIMNILINDSKLYQSFFLRFYNNHQQINSWYMLANSNQNQIKKYVFASLLSKKIKDYRQMVKDTQEAYVYNRTNDVFRQQQRNRRQKKKQSFHKMRVENIKSHSILRDHGKQHKEKLNKYQIQGEINTDQLQKQDYHQLFMKTFSACDGSKYIYYDFNKHMRGIQDKKRYNDFIRIKKHHKKYVSNTIQLTENERAVIKINQQFCKTINNSLHSKQNTKFLHEKQEQLQHIKYCNITLDPIGHIQKKKYIRQVILLRKTAGGLKKIRPNTNNANRFHLNKNKI